MAWTPTVDVVDASAVTDWEPWEGALVQLDGITVGDDLGFGEYAVTVGEGAVDFRIDDMVWDDVGLVIGTGDTMGAVTGFVHYSYSNWKLQPRNADDLSDHVIYEPPPPSCPDADKCVFELEEGDLVITEIMFNPAFGSDSSSEWVEIWNASGGSVNINGLIVMETGGSDGEVTEDVIIAASSYMVLAVGDGTSFAYTSFVPDAFYGSLAFGNGGDEISLWAEGLQVDWAPSYGDDTLSFSAGESFQLDYMFEDAVSNDILSNWCVAGTVDPDLIGESGDLGTPFGEAFCGLP
jgi:hypothetical protein